MEESVKEAFFVSFPKNGRTWIRIILSKIIYETFNLSEKEIPEYYLLNIKRLCEEAGRIPITMTHDDSANHLVYKKLEEDKSNYIDKKVILLIRDPRDTLVSYYFHRTKRWKPIDDKGISAFIRDKRYGIRKILRFYNIWNQWINKIDEVLVVRYEDMHMNPKTTIKRMLAFLEIQDEVSEEIIDHAIEFANFNNLKHLEKENYFHTNKMRPADLNDDETFKVRRGVVNGFDDYLLPDDIEFLNDLIIRTKCPLINYYKEIIKYEKPQGLRWINTTQ